MNEIKAWLDLQMQDPGVATILLLLAAGGLFTGIGLSRQAFALLAGYAFGAMGGTALSLAAEMIGVTLAFSFARYLGRDWVVRRFGDRIRKFDNFLGSNPVTMTMAAKLFPLGSNVVLNLLAGVSSVPLRPYLLGSAVGHLPQSAVFATAGAGIATSRQFQIVLAIVLFALSTLIGLHLYRKYRHFQLVGTGSDRRPARYPPR